MCGAAAASSASSHRQSLRPLAVSEVLAIRPANRPGPGQGGVNGVPVPALLN